ncbi:tubulin polyglutamylase complex subunit 1-like isoform X1 [Branchiostoma lanceolatum]|uniref:tubulin polyglutamylase complex subunit 1-like isoform X1 n=1 Tax=Branchiostoma lanceolatum TaxID=7740 RepID=UPI003451E781
MAEKRKPASAEEKMPESNRDFLEKSAVRGLMRGAISKLIENRPEDPIAFLAEYFDSADNKPGSNKVAKAHQELLLTHHSRPAFESNMLLAYQILSAPKNAKGKAGLKGDLFTELLTKILREVPSEVSDVLLKKLLCYENEVIPYDIFHSGVMTCFIFLDYYAEAEGLFTVLDTSGKKEVDKELCDVALNQLSAAMTVTKDDPKSILEGASKLRPDALAIALDNAFDSVVYDETMAKDEFVMTAVVMFIAKVKPMR